MKMLKRIAAIGLMSVLCFTVIVYGAENKTKIVGNKKLITVDMATKIALEKNLDLKTYDAQRDKIQANIDAYFSNMANSGLYIPGAENALGQVQYAGAQSFLAKDKLERGITLKAEAIKNSVENSFMTISKFRREVQSLEDKYNRELALYNIDNRKYEIGTISKTQLEEKRLGLLNSKTALTGKKTDLETSYGELNKLLKLSKFNEYVIDDYNVEYSVLDWDKEKVENYIRTVPNYNMDVLNKRGEADFNRNEIGGILAINGGKEPYLSIKADGDIAELSAAQLAEASEVSARDKYSNLKQLQEGINAIEQNLKTLELQETNLKTRYKVGQVAKADLDQIQTTIAETKNNLKTQKDTYMNLRRMFENRYLAGLSAS